MNSLRFVSVLAVVLLFSCFSTRVNSQIRINEILAWNENDILDAFLESNDWIELYNAGQNSVNLAGYYLSDNQDSLDLWRFPLEEPDFTTIEPGEYMILWADNDLAQGWNHLPFRLGIDGETLLLTMPDGVTIADQIEFPAQQYDISYGRETDGAETWVFFNNTTPGASNNEILQAPALVFINEVLPVNVSGIRDENNEYEGWIEIFNPNNFQVNLAGYFLGTPGDPDMFQIPFNDPTKTCVEPNGFRIFWMDGEPGQGADHVSFELIATGAQISLAQNNGVNIVNNYTYPSAIADFSWGRVSDGAVSSQFFSIPTPRVSNGLVIIEPEELFINEVLASNLNGISDNAGQLEDWFEIYNPNPYPVNIAGYYFTDNPSNPVKFQVPEGSPELTTVPAEGWLLFWADEDASTQGANHVSFRLNNQGETLQMFGLDGFSMVDEIQFGFIPDNYSIGREQDGSPAWILFEEPTPEASNSSGEVTISENGEAYSLNLYPNPANHKVVSSQEGLHFIFSSTGNLIAEITSENGVLDFSGFAEGIYHIKTETGHFCRLLILPN
jgi:LEA14-like dessication related protein